MGKHKDLVKMAVQAYENVPTEFSSVDQISDALNAEVLERLGKTIPDFQQNKYEFYNLIQETVDEILPKRILDNMGMFANYKHVKHGERATFTRTLGKGRAKQFITKVAPSGAYESFRLDQETYDVVMSAVGGKVEVDFESFLAGRENLVDRFEIILDGIEENIYKDLQVALSVAIANMPTANKAITNAFDSVKMREVINTVRTYGEGAVIFCPPEFAAQMDLPIFGNNTNPNTDVRDIASLRDRGYLDMFYGCPVILIPQSFTDETNTEKVINTQQAYIFPTGKEKVADIVTEGETVITDFQKRSRALEIEAYKKSGIVIHHYHNWGTYVNTGIAQEVSYLKDVKWEDYE